MQGILTLAIIFLTSILSASQFESGYLEIASAENKLDFPRRIYDNQSVGMEITAKSAAVADVKTDSYLWTKNEKQRQPIASLTKLMTAAVFLQHNPGWDKLVTLEKSDEVTHAKYIYRGEQVNISDIFNTSLIGSDNNATMALVRSTGLTNDEFVGLLNQQAREWGMLDTNFKDPTGLSKENVSTVADLIILAQHVYNNDAIDEATGQEGYYINVLNTGKRRYIPSTNKLWDTYLRVENGKTGYTEEAGYCLLSRLKKDQGDVFIVVLGSREETDRFQDTKALAWWIFNNYKWE